jgi:hypothetical protein
MAVDEQHVERAARELASGLGEARGCVCYVAPGSEGAAHDFVHMRVIVNDEYMCGRLQQHTLLNNHNPSTPSPLPLDTVENLAVPVVEARCKATTRLACAEQV